VAAVAEAGGVPVFLDLKLHDIPNTVAGAVRAAGGLGAAYLTVHAAGGPAMLEAAASAAAGLATPPRLLAVTVLTSLDRDDLARTGVRAEPLDQALLLASLARRCGVGGIVCSAEEIAAMRESLGPDPLIAVPGLRPAGADAATRSGS
jgi:orotidine-5'-phosphate decarboxylase